MEAGIAERQVASLTEAAQALGRLASTLTQPKLASGSLARRSA